MVAGIALGSFLRTGMETTTGWKPSIHSLSDCLDQTIVYWHRAMCLDTAWAILLIIGSTYQPSPVSLKIQKRFIIGKSGAYRKSSACLQKQRISL